MHGVSQQGFYNFGLKNAILALFSDADWVKARGSDRHRDQPNTVYGSTVVTEINENLGGAANNDPAFQKANSFYALGEDACQPFYNASRSVNLVFLK